MKELDPLATLKTFVAGHPNQRTAAAALGITQSYLSDLVNGRRDLSDQLLAQLGLRRIVVKAS